MHADLSGTSDRTVNFAANEGHMHVESVECGLDHMAAVVAIDRSLLGH